MAPLLFSQCGSSQQALHFAAQAVMSGVQDVVIAGGVEVMVRFLNFFFFFFIELKTFSFLTKQKKKKSRCVQLDQVSWMVCLLVMEILLLPKAFKNVSEKNNNT